MKCIDFYAGIGGFRLGFGLEYWQKHGIYTKREIQFIWADELDKYARAVYRYHFGECDGRDITTVPPDEIPDADLWTFGTPCQDFSVASRREGIDGSRGNLTLYTLELLEVKRPRYFLMENVPGLLSIGGRRPFAYIIGRFVEMGYCVSWLHLNSKHFGVPQNRERIFIVGARGRPRPEVFSFGEAGQDPDGTQGEAQGEGSRFRGEHSRSLRVGGSGREENLIASTLSHRYHKDGSDQLILHNIYDGFGEKEPRMSKDESPSIRTPKGGGHSGGHHSNMTLLETPTIRSEHHNTADVHFIEESPEDVAPTIRQTNTRSNQKPIAVPEVANICDADGYLRYGERPGDKDGKPTLVPIGRRRIRRLTPLECERLQGFPDNWTAKGIDDDGNEIEISDTQRYKMCGNAVTVNVVRHFARAFKLREDGED